MSAIAKTASITLLTGVPGNGKTLRAVWYIEQAVKAGEEVFVCNLNGLNIDGVTEFPDPTRWEELPAGAILVVDEAQRFFRAAAGAVPDCIKAMETIRHVGIRLILITQSPALIHANIRALVGLHEHLVRENGKQSAIVYRRSRVIDNVRSDKALAVEDHEAWAYPKHCYALYKSAEVHAVKRTMPSKYKRAIALAALALTILGGVMWQLRGVTSAGDKPAAPPRATAPAGAWVGRPRQLRRLHAMHRPRITQSALPRFDSMPWTAPLFDERSPVADPQLYCLSSMPTAEDAREPSCTCLTEQGTRYEISQAQCRTIARYGTPYNPYRQQQQQQPAGQVEPIQQAAAAPTPAAAGSVIEQQDRALGTFPESKQVPMHDG